MDPRSGYLYGVVTDDLLSKALDAKVSHVDAAFRSARDRVVSESEARERGFVPVQRELTDREREDGRVGFSSPCACGSGKKFKHCCFTRARR